VEQEKNFLLKKRGYKCPECGHAQLNEMVKSKRELLSTSIKLIKIRISVVFTLAEG
jgi:DNA-directed RNA polymerase subunit RPC12/RpoP